MSQKIIHAILSGLPASFTKKNIYKNVLSYKSFFYNHLLILYVCVLFAYLYVPLEQPWLSSSAQNPSALESIQNLEASKHLLPKEEDDETDFSVPIFVEHINNVSCIGGETAHFQCKVEPKNDPSLEISKSHFYPHTIIHIYVHFFLAHTVFNLTRRMES